ncbi:MAG: NAD-dependent epimerase/dehydratase family protein [Proteobacteria bacterium]|nr:NAD-dependent epimerase/dehydratase family protein [Pseudomonadota bacterium]
MKVLVTGGGGFLGSAICKQLVARGHAVRTFSRNRHPLLDTLGVEQHLGDIASMELVIEASRGVDAIVHCAGKVAPWGSLEDFYETNVRGTDNVLAACELNEINRLVFTSSSSVVQTGTDQEGIDETAPYAQPFLNAYAHTKALAEQRVLAANSPQLATVALRPQIVWGPDDPTFVPRILAQARAGRLRLIGKTPKKLDSVYIDNAADAHVLALEKLAIGSTIAGKTYFVTQGEPVLNEALVNGWLNAGGFPPETRRLPLGVAQFLARTLESTYGVLRIAREPPLTRFAVDVLSSALWFDISAARRDLGYSPRVNMAEGMARLAQHLTRERLQKRG